MEARIQVFGKIIVEENHVTITGLGSEEKIPYHRISSVAASKLMGRVTISTSGAERQVQLWNAKRVTEIADAINERVDAHEAKR